MYCPCLSCVPIGLHISVAQNRSSRYWTQHTARTKCLRPFDFVVLSFSRKTLASSRHPLTSALLDTTHTPTVDFRIIQALRASHVDLVVKVSNVTVGLITRQFLLVVRYPRPLVGNQSDRILHPLQDALNHRVRGVLVIRQSLVLVEHNLRLGGFSPPSSTSWSPPSASGATSICSIRSVVSLILSR